MEKQTVRTLSLQNLNKLKSRLRRSVCPNLTYKFYNRKTLLQRKRYRRSASNSHGFYKRI